MKEITTEKELYKLLDKLAVLQAEIGKVVVGQKDAIEEIIIAFISGGHALLEGVPGLAKTLMVRTLAEAVDLKFNRIQFTPDLMPSDILGTEVLEEDHNTGKKIFRFNKGPVFSNVLLADEINRTPPKTQAAMLEAMQEYAVTYGGKTYPLEKPFFIIATQNPIEQAGTFPLPEAQLDRFLLFIRVGYPSEQEEELILTNTTGSTQAQAQSVVSAEELLQLQKTVRDVHINNDLVAYVNKIVRATRPANTTHKIVKDWVRWGAGPRAGQALILTAKARSLTNKRLSVLKEDIDHMAFPVLRHRMLLNFRAEAENISTDDITKKLLEQIAIPMNGIK